MSAAAAERRAALDLQATDRHVCGALPRRSSSRPRIGPRSAPRSARIAKEGRCRRCPLRGSERGANDGLRAQRVRVDEHPQLGLAVEERQIAERAAETFTFLMKLRMPSCSSRFCMCATSASELPL